jgi:uncharacterized protein (TIGR02246 family)
MRRIVMGVVGLAMAGTVQANEPRGAAPEASRESPTLDPGLAQQLQPTMNAFQDAWNRHDTKAMAATFAPDAVLINPNGRVARGREEIEKLFEDEHQRGPMKGTEFRHRVTGVRQVAPGLVFLDEEATITGTRDPSGRALPDQQVHASMLVAKRGDGWQVVEGRPYIFAPSAPRGVASGEGRSGDTAAAPKPTMGGTGSGIVSGDADSEPAHTGP